MNKIKTYVKKLWNIVFNPSMAYLPGNLAFFLMLSIFPILTLIGVIASELGVNIGSLINVINTTLPKDVANVLVAFIDGKGFDSNIGIFMIIGFYLASNGADAIILASNNLYGFPNSDYIKRRIKAIFLIVLIIFALMFLLVFLGFGNHLLSFSLSYIKDKSVVNLIKNIFSVLKWPFSIFIIFFNVKLIYTIAPDWKIMSKHTTLGAAFTTICWIVIIQIYSYWVTHFTHYDLFYGSMSNIIILMLIVYIISYILVIGIAINVKAYEYKPEISE